MSGAIFTPGVTPALNGFENRLIVNADLSLATWNTVAGHAMFSITGPVRAIFIYYVTETFTSGGAATVSFGLTGFPADYAAAQTYANLQAGRHIDPGATIATLSIWWSRFMNSARQADCIITNNIKHGYTIAAAAMTDGALRGICYWSSLDGAGAVVAGDGGAL